MGRERLPDFGRKELVLFSEDAVETLCFKIGVVFPVVEDDFAVTFEMSLRYDSPE